MSVLSQDAFCCYKYRKIEKNLIESLVNPSLYFAKRDELNDPFDCQIDIEKVINNPESYLSNHWLTLRDNQDFFNVFDSNFDSVGVFSTTLDKDNPLLWSHYADGHKGVCLKYEFPYSFMSQFESTEAYEVKYLKPNESISDLLNQLPEEGFALSHLLVKLYLTTKSHHWHYENEKRIFYKPGVLPIDPECLKAIYFGLRTPESDIDHIRKLAEKHCGCNTFFQMVRDNSGLGFKPEQL